jgi:hypothetical protein
MIGEGVDRAGTVSNAPSRARASGSEPADGDLTATA